MTRGGGGSRHPSASIPHVPLCPLKDGALVHELIGILRLGAQVVCLCQDGVTEVFVGREVEIQLKARVGRLHVLERDVREVFQRVLVVLLDELSQEREGEEREKK